MILAFLVADLAHIDGSTTTFTIGVMGASFFVLAVAYMYWTIIRQLIRGQMPADYGDSEVWTGIGPAIRRWFNIVLWFVGFPLYLAITVLALGLTE